MTEPHKWTQDTSTNIGGICATCGESYGVVEHCPNPWRDQLVSAIATLKAIRDDDLTALGLDERMQRIVRESGGEADYHVTDAVRFTARRTLEDLGEFL